MTTADKGAFAPIHVYSPGQAGPFEDWEYVNFDKEIQAAKALSLHARDDAARESILAFGYAGNGKRAFAQCLSRDLFRLGFHVVWLEIGSLISPTSDSVKQEIDQARQYVMSPEHRPLLIVANGLDFLRPDVFGTRALDTVQLFIRDCFAPPTPPQLVVLGTAATPEPALQALHPSVPWLFYFDWPGEEDIKRFFELLKIDERKDVAKELYGLATEKGYRYTAGSLITGASGISRMPASSRYFWDMPKQELAQTILNLCSPTPLAKYEEYFEATRDYRRMAGALLKQWDLSRESTAPSVAGQGNR